MKCEFRVRKGGVAYMKRKLADTLSWVLRSEPRAGSESSRRSEGSSSSSSSSCSCGCLCLVGGDGGGGSKSRDRSRSAAGSGSEFDLDRSARCCDVVEIQIILGLSK